MAAIGRSARQPRRCPASLLVLVLERQLLGRSPFCSVLVARMVVVLVLARGRRSSPGNWDMNIIIKRHYLT